MSRNWRAAGGGEIDLVVWQPGTIVVVEVKARASDRFGTPAEAVGAAKQRQLRRLAAAWLGEHPQHRGALRFDVAAITGTNLEIITAAF